MAALKVATLSAVFCGLIFLIAYYGSAQDEKRTSNAAAPVPTAAQSKQEQKPDADEDEDEEGPPTPAAVSPEKAAPLQPAGQQVLYNFDADSGGQPPAKFHAARTGAGPESKWVVMPDRSAPSKPNVVVQTSTDPTDYRFPLLIADEASFRDLDLSIKFKAVSGSIDRAGGLVFRLKDPNNYYIVRANALENNYRLYHVVNGRRSQFAGANFKVTSGEWHELRVEVAGNKITCYYDGSKKIEATDNTFKEAGKVGLWTKADSVTYFDDLKVVAK
jgi:3-keto-disaccharide hydrolase